LTGLKICDCRIVVLWVTFARQNEKTLSSRYDHLNKEELLRLLEARDQRDATRFGLVWEANEIERDKALNNDFVALDLVQKQSVGAAPWRNLIIEGDNYDALRFLRMTFAGQVKCILIDPPYNTGKKDFVYNDSFVDEKNSWRFSTWIEFLYQRLVIARDLLSEDGVLLCCINDENRAKLEMLLDKVMPKRRVGSFVWRTKDSANDAGGNMSQVHEHVLVYANHAFAFKGKPLVLDDYRNPDQDQRGDWTPQPLTKAATLKTRENTYYPVQDPETGYWFPCDPDRVWAYATEKRLKPEQKLRAKTMEELIRGKEIYFPPCKPAEVMRFETKDELLKAIRAGKGPILPKKKKPLLREDLPDLDFWIGKPIAPGRPSLKDFLKNKTKMVAPVSSWIAGEKEVVDFVYDDQEAQTELLRSARGGEGNDELVAILGKKAFDHPKPPSLIRSLVQQATGPNDLVLDFFAGSGTTAQSVLETNKADGEKGQRRFILVSSTEATEDEPDKNVCRDICAVRVGNVINGYGNAPGLGGDFAYLRTSRIQPGKLLEIEHNQVWTALQLAKLDAVLPYADEPFLWAGNGDSAICYVPRFSKKIVTALRRKMKESAEVAVFSWQPQTLRQHVRDAHVTHFPVSETLTRWFGLNLTLSPA
jgi:adenine-specific DNA-methyltransferase